MENGTEIRESYATATAAVEPEEAILFYRKFKKLTLPLVITLGLLVVLLLFAVVRIHDLETAYPEMTDDHITETLTQISELATMSFEYTNQKTVTDTRKIFGFDIPGTTKTVDIVYSGVIKVGYDVQAIPCTLDEAEKTLTFTLPAPTVLDNYIILDTLQCTDGNNILNPIGSDDIIGYFGEIEAEELARAEENGIYAEAEKQLKSIITHYFAVFPDYTVQFAK